MRCLILSLVLTLAGCPEPVVPKPAPIPEDTNWCGAAEERLEELQCKDMSGDPMWVNKNGERFKQTCETAQEEGRIALNPRCIAKAPNCEEAKQCPII